MSVAVLTALCVQNFKTCHIPTMSSNTHVCNTSFLQHFIPTTLLHVSILCLHVADLQHCVCMLLEVLSNNPDSLPVSLLRHLDQTVEGRVCIHKCIRQVVHRHTMQLHVNTEKKQWFKRCILRHTTGAGSIAHGGRGMSHQFFSPTTL